MKLARERNGSLDVARLMKTTEATGTGKDERTWTLALEKLADRASVDRRRGSRARAGGEARDPRPRAHCGELLECPRREVDDVRCARAWASADASRGTARSRPIPCRSPGKLDVSGLDLVTVRPYVESRVNVSLTAGALAAKGSFAVDVPERAPIKASVEGQRHGHRLRRARQADGLRSRCDGSVSRSRTSTSRPSRFAWRSVGSASRTTTRA